MSVRYAWNETLMLTDVTLGLETYETDVELEENEVAYR